LIKNQHLIPVNVLDLVEKINSKYINEYEKQNYIMRLEAIRDCCDNAVKKANNKSMFEDLHSRKANTGKKR